MIKVRCIRLVQKNIVPRRLNQPIPYRVYTVIVSTASGEYFNYLLSEVDNLKMRNAEKWLI